MPPSTKPITGKRKMAVIALAALTATSIPLGIRAYTSFPAITDTLPIAYVAQDEVSNFNLAHAGGTAKDPVTGLVSVAPGLETLYRVEYNRQNWTGDVHAYPLDSAGNLYPAERWSAATQLAAQNWDTGRFIATLNSSSTVAGIALRASLVSAITVNGVHYTQAQVLNYLRGDTSNDAANGGQLRIRTSPLGDIVHSRPYYVDDTTNPTVFVGSNDGMLHAFSADTGAERWAYVPSMLLGKLHTLAYSPGDAAQPYKHDYFVDGQINIGSIQSSSGSSIRALFGGLGAGGKGLYAVDISSLSNPGHEAAVASKILWEIAPNAAGTSSTIKRVGAAVTNTTDYMRMGYTFGTPLLVKIRTAGTPSYVDALVVGNGYDDGAAGTAHLYVIHAATGALLKDFAVPAYAGLTGANGIFNPKAVDANNDGYVDTVYGADLNGSLWKFDLSAAYLNHASWSAPTAPLFSDKDSGSGTTQPITSSLGIAAHPKWGYMITFGTGAAQTTSTDTHYVYGIWDGAPGAGTVTPGSLLTQTITERLYGSTRVRRASANAPNWASGGHRGWKVALPAGEQVVGEGSFIENGRFYFNSYNPTVAPSAVPGSSALLQGENWLMELNYLTGGSSDAPFFDMDGNSLLNDNDRIRYSASDTRPIGKQVGDAIVSPNENGIPVGKWIANGVQSQPVLLQLAHLNTTLLNQNPDLVEPQATSLFPRNAPVTHPMAGARTEGTSSGTSATANLPMGSTASTSRVGTSGTTTTGGPESGANARRGRISWREWLRP